jgi:hypothetical protein
MSTLRLGLGALLVSLVGAGCTPIDPAQNTFPQQPEPTQVSGPPGGNMDPAYGYPQQQPQAVAYNAPDQPGYPQGYAPGYPDGTTPSTEDQAAEATAAGGELAQPSIDPASPGYDMGQVTDPEIDATLEGYGQWEETDDYGRVWRPDTTAVGVDFTPYETCGSWIWSDAGWNFNCDWSWGWLPFHYGRWGWFDGYWGWQPGYAWSPGAVEWRGGGGYTGWRPLTPVIRDHRTGHQTPTFHDHRGVIAHDSQWRFSRDNDFGHGHIRGHLFQNPAEGLRSTSPVARPNLRANYAPVSSASLMRARMSGYQHSASISGGVRAPVGAGGPAGTGFRQPERGYRNPSAIRNQQPYRGDTPTWRRPDAGYRAPATSYRPTYRPPAQTWNRGSYNPPARSYGTGTYTGPSRSYTPPSRAPGGYTHPAPSGGGWTRPSSGGGGSRGGGFTGSSPTIHSSSGSSGGGGGFHSSGGGGHSSGGGGGGGRHR